MEDKVVLVTGSSSGIGEAAVLKFSSLGCKVVVHGRNDERVRRVVEKCTEVSPRGHKPLAVIGDIRDGNVLASLIEETISTFGQLDVLVNNAGSFVPVKFDQLDSYKQYSETIQVNLNSVVMLTSLACEHLKRTRGSIINISSNLHSQCFEGAFAYCIAKAGLTMFTKSIAVDLAPLVRVNSISPGPVATRMSSRRGIDIDVYRSTVGQACLTGQVGEPEDVARVIAFLASPESRYITGSDIIIDGGSSIKP